MMDERTHYQQMGPGGLICAQVPAMEHPLQRFVYRPPVMMAPQYSFLEQSTASGFGKKPDEWFQGSVPPQKVHRAQSDTTAVRKKRKISSTKLDDDDAVKGLFALVSASGAEAKKAKLNNNANSGSKNEVPEEKEKKKPSSTGLKKPPTKVSKSVSASKQKSQSCSDDEEASELRSLLPIPVPTLEDEGDHEEEEEEFNGETEEAKKLRRLHKNRLSAQLSRQRKQLYVQTLEKNVRHFIKKEESEKNELRQVNGQLEWLRTKVNNLLKAKGVKDLGTFKERLQNIMHERPPEFS